MTIILIITIKGRLGGPRHAHDQKLYNELSLPQGNPTEGHVLPSTVSRASNIVFHFNEDGDIHVLGAGTKGCG
jgi:hypothetical protein